MFARSLPLSKRHQGPSMGRTMITSAAPKPDVKVVLNDGLKKVECTAKPGTSLMELIADNDMLIDFGCSQGSCGTCEMELRKFGPDGGDENAEGGSVVVRTCVNVVPRGFKRVELSLMTDGVWGVDGLDT